tara:strand:- start:604 stop:954 length:351 start_codon:yes stop_codon:yes gene_type:complete
MNLIINKIMKLTKKSENTLKRLELKANDVKGARMPQLKMVSRLLNELNIKNYYYDWSEYKYTSCAGLRYTTGGGTREYNGGKLNIPSINLNAISTETYYSWNSRGYASKIVNLINQ